MRIPRILGLLILTGLLVPDAADAALGDHLWSRGWSVNGQASTDASGNIATGGTFFAPTNFGGGVFAPGNFLAGDVFLARYDAGGSHLWSLQFTPGGFGLIVDAVAAAPDGSIYLAGVLQNGDIDFGGGILAGNGVSVLAAFQPDGTHNWSFVIGSGRVTELDASNAAVACTGYASANLDFGGGVLVNAGGSDVFLGVLNPDGTHKFSQMFGDAGEQGGMSVALDPNDGIVLAAAAASNINFGGGVLTPFAGTDLCLAAFDAGGVHQWSWIRAGTFTPGAGILLQLDVAVSGTGEIALAGQFQGNPDLGGGPLANAGSDDIFLARYTSGGIHLSSESYGGTSSDGAQGVTWDSAGNLALSGTFRSPAVTFGGAPLLHSGGFGSDWFAAVLDDTGAHLFSRPYTGNGQYEMVPRFQASGELLLWGAGGGNTNFGGGVVANTGLFLAMLEGATTVTASPVLPGAIRLAQNTPNPFNPRTSIRFRLAEAADVGLEIFDAAGRRVRSLTLGRRSAGDHDVVFDGRDAHGRELASGVYHYRLRSGNESLVRRMVLVR